MMKVFVDYPTKDQELEIMRRISNMQFAFEVNTVLTKEDIFAIRNEVNQVKISESLEKYIIELVSATRRPKEYKLDKEAQYIQFGGITARQHKHEPGCKGCGLHGWTRLCFAGRH